MRVHYKTFGCKANQYDTERMRQALAASGEGRIARTDRFDDADLCVVNTCTVTSQADADARRFARRVRRVNPGAKVVVAGCSAALRAPEYRRMEEVDEVVAGHDPEAVVAAASRAVRGISLVQLRRVRRGTGGVAGGEVLRRRAGRARGWLKVQDGCDRKCSFCATRLARGASRSRDPGVVVAEALMLARSHPELVVTGVHIGHYGRDLDPPSSLSALVRRLLDEVPGARLRLGSIEATEIDDELLELLAGSDGRLAPHLHMPLQSGADPVLRGMRRWHTSGQYRRRALEIASHIAPLGLGADVIAAFRGRPPPTTRPRWHSSTSSPSPTCTSFRGRPGAAPSRRSSPGACRSAWRGSGRVSCERWRPGRGSATRAAGAARRWRWFWRAAGGAR